MFSWEAISRFGKSQVLATSYIWIVIVPVLAKLLTQLESPVMFFGQSIELILPFSWQVFYFSAVLIALAGVVYHLRCPPIIKNFSSLSDYQDQNKGIPYLFEYSLKYGYRLFFKNVELPVEKKTQLKNGLRDRYKTNKVGELSKIKKIHLDVECIDDHYQMIDDDSKERSFYKGVFFGSEYGRHFERYKKHLPEAYRLLCKAEDESRKWSRIVCWVFYVLGLAGIVFIMIDNFYEVLKQTGIFDWVTNKI